MASRVKTLELLLCACWRRLQIAIVLPAETGRPTQRASIWCANKADNARSDAQYLRANNRLALTMDAKRFCYRFLALPQHDSYCSISRRLSIKVHHQLILINLLTSIKVCLLLGQVWSVGRMIFISSPFSDHYSFSLAQLAADPADD